MSLLSSAIRRYRQFLQNKSLLRVLSAACLGVLFVPQPLWACAACYGQSDSAMAAGMNWGILSLLGMIVFVLGGVAGFFVFLARRAVKTAALNPAAALPAAVGGQDQEFAPLDSKPLHGRAGVRAAPVLVRRQPRCAQPARHARN